MLDKEDLEKELGYKITNTKYQEILNLPYQDLTRIRSNHTGKHFHRLYVLGRAPTVYSGSQPITAWWCICSCDEHNIISVRGNNLTSGNSKSCGCWDKEVAKKRMSLVGKKAASNITGQKFGKLTALEPTDLRSNNSIVWKCLCDCGNIHYVAAKELKRNNISSCGCLKVSKGVLKIEELLKENNIPYEKEKTYLDCKFEDTQVCARFDFFINNEFLLEFDGEQHFKEKNFFRDSLEKRQEHDKFKTNYCKRKGIPLKRVPYWEYKNLTIEKIMGDEFLC